MSRPISTPQVRPERLQIPGWAVVFLQGDPASDINYIQKGAIKLSVLSRIGKEAVVAMLAPGDFFGEGVLAGQSVRIGTATAVVATSVLSIEKAMVGCSTSSPRSRTASSPHAGAQRPHRPTS
jgi:CRP-like cAMP-binding protein